MHQAKVSRSKRSGSGTVSTRLSMTGAIQPQVRRWRSIEASTASGSNSRCTHSVPPTHSTAMPGRSNAPTWYSGPTTSSFSLAVSPSAITWSMDFQWRLP
ncbi:Uncharacterised protein [Bordetella pertussis]|nr:Uncharacterised protein [Bordetella pertussis]